MGKRVSKEDCVLSTFQVSSLVQALRAGIHPKPLAASCRSQLSTDSHQQRRPEIASIATLLTFSVAQAHSFFSGASRRREPYSGHCLVRAPLRSPVTDGGLLDFEIHVRELINRSRRRLRELFDCIDSRRSCSCVFPSSHLLKHLVSELIQVRAIMGLSRPGCGIALHPEPPFRAGCLWSDPQFSP